MLRGKGLWAYLTQELDRALEIAPRMGATHILFKVGHGSAYFQGMDAVACRIKEAGLIPFGWMWLRLDDPAAESQVAVQAFQDGFEGFVFDTEAGSCEDRLVVATQLGEHLMAAGVDPHTLYNCSFPNISHHRNLPYDQMNVFCKGGLMPMSYGSYFLPGSALSIEQQAGRVIDEWTYGHYTHWCRLWGYRPPMSPVLGPYRDEHANVRMGPDEFRVWLARLQAHGPTFFSVFRAGVLNDDLLPLIRDFPLGAGTPPEPSGLQVEVVSPELGFVRLRPSPSTAQDPVAQVAHGAVLESLENEAQTRAKVTVNGQWLYVRTLVGDRGYVAAWYLRFPEAVVVPEEPAPAEEPVEKGVQVEVVSPDLGFLRIRPTPSTAQEPVARVDDGTVLESLESEESTRAKVGKRGQWLQLRTPAGDTGFAGAWYLRLHGEAPVGESIPYVIVRSAVGLNVRPAAGTGQDPTWHVVDGTVMQVLEDPKRVGTKIGKDAWINVRAPSLHEGFVNGLYVGAGSAVDARRPVADASLPAGECAWIFGIHAAESTRPADFRFLFQGKDKAGWVLFTEAIGADPNHTGGHDYSPWLQNGYGVIVRLNNGYEPAGTLPVQARYDDFARACARYVQNSRKCHIWIIANEQNNPREHPGGADASQEHITPRMYARAFNLARQRIKAVQPEAVVVPGAVDPYFGLPWKLNGQTYRPLDYFKEMLDHIDDLDGVCLHTYTHWMDVDLITAKTVFTNAPLDPGTPHEHYYDFQAYRSFAEAIPTKWHSRPIYMTESNHWIALERQAHPGEQVSNGWVNKDKGWVRAAYAEIDRWNRTPHAQQIHCYLLYRWTGDAWAIEGLGEIHKDLRQALDHDYRWRR